MIKEHKRELVIVGLMLLLIIALIGVSYAAFSYSKQGTKVNTITTGSITMSYEETDNTISLNGALPTTDETGKVRLTEGEYFDFKVSSSITGNVNINYEISAKDVTTAERKIDGSNIKLYLTELVDGEEQELMTPEVYNEETSSNTYTGRPANEMSLYTSSMNSSEEHTYRLRMYVTEEYNPQGDGGNLSFSVKINVYGKDGENSPVQVNAPELDSNMIAVRYDGSNWVKADSSTNNWYNYDKQEWANAVTVSSSSRSTYLSAPVGTTISMDDIETMWVWIPRYSYTIGSEDGTNYYGKQGDYLDSTPTQALPGEIDVKFVSTSTKDRGTAKYIVSSGIQSNSWYTPDAFTFGDEELSGIWVGKFETSSSNPSTENGGGNTTELDAMIKPNVTSWRYINISNAFTVALKMNDAGNRYGFSSNVDTHMMKNSEWGAVAYLSQSKYGKLGNTDYIGANKEVYQNKSDQMITGCSWGHPSGGTTEDYGCQYTYNIDINGTGASTTGTIYGVYDMSGCTWEYVMGNFNDKILSSGFISMPESKYYDKYTSNNVSIACNNNECLSHALSETASWFEDTNTQTVNDSYAWMLRGGLTTSNPPVSAGVFYFFVGGHTGGPYANDSFRLVMSPSL